MIEITLLGTGSPIPDPNRAGPSTLVRVGGQVFLVDCGRGVLQRAAAVGVGAAGLSALLLTHLHSDHIGDLGDLLITRWISTFAPDPAPLPIIGPPGTAETVEATLKAFGHDIGYRIAHHADLNAPPAVEVHEYTEGPVWDRGGVSIRVAPTDHRPVAPTIGFRIESGTTSVVLAGDTVAAGRQYSLLGDAELDEGAVWEAIVDPGVAELGGDRGTALMNVIGEPAQPRHSLWTHHDLAGCAGTLGRYTAVGDRGHADPSVGERPMECNQIVGDQPLG